MSRPWTEGPWAVDLGATELGVSAVTTGPDGMYERRATVCMLASEHPCSGSKDWWADNWTNDVALIALAPRMAEAILAYCGEPGSYMSSSELHDAEVGLSAVADELRKIIKEHDDE